VNEYLLVLIAASLRYEQRATQLVVDFAQSRSRFLSLPMLSVRLTHFVSDLLALSPSLSHSVERETIQRVSRQQWSWRQLDDERCFQVILLHFHLDCILQTVFVMIMMT
jgi:hypothetical protein